MITATATLQATITATATLMAVQTGSCAAATITVNSAAYDTVASGGALNVQVKNTLGSFVGSLVAGLWQIANSQVVIKNSLATIIATQSVAAEASADYTLADTTYVFQINGVNQNSVTVASMIDYTFNINFVP